MSAFPATPPGLRQAQRARPTGGIANQATSP